METIRIIGGAGTGKTTHLMRMLAQWLERGWVSPFGVGFVSFTRAARHEAASRAAKVCGESQDDLEQNGYFKTIHSVCYRQLGIDSKELLTDERESRKWLSEALGAEFSGAAEPGEDEPVSVREAASDAENAVNLWNVARNRLLPLENVWRSASEINEFTPGWDAVRSAVEKYEQAKRLDHRCDFADILGRFAGLRFSIEGPEESAFEGVGPCLKLWFLDEWQDASALLDRVARRLVDGAEWVYVAADPFQAIYQFSGSSPQHFMDWIPDKERILDQSHRCPRSVLALGEEILRECSDYWDRKIQPRPEEGEILVDLFNSGWAEDVDPRKRWLILARSNNHALRLSRRLDDLGIPWVPTRGHGGKWAAPVRRAACLGLISLENGHAINAGEWTAALKYLPSKSERGELLKHGAKAEWGRLEIQATELTDLEHLPDWGATETLCETIRSGAWESLIENGGPFRAAWKRWGHAGVLNPQVEVGTIHSAKGAEAENVVLLTTTSRQCSRAMESTETADEERRVAYVAVTRAKQRLIILREPCLHRMEIPV
jgi:DNA helicase-2/ATP-dependent DNA helicase PcrA